METKSINERANEWAKWQMADTPYPKEGTVEEQDAWNMQFNLHEDTYIDIAREQRDVDIQQTCKILREMNFFKSEAAMEEQFISLLKG